MTSPSGLNLLDLRCMRGAYESGALVVGSYIAEVFSNNLSLSSNLTHSGLKKEDAGANL